MNEKTVYRRAAIAMDIKVLSLLKHILINFYLLGALKVQLLLFRADARVTVQQNSYKRYTLRNLVADLLCLVKVNLSTVGVALFRSAQQATIRLRRI